jgi:Tle cognate immunity protein 4 C-terminal domain/Tle cognate immunity protein 4 N-terminal domain
MKTFWHWMIRFDTLGDTLRTVGRMAVLLVLTSLLSFCTYGRLAPTFYTPKTMPNFSGQTQTQCVGRYLVDAPVELGRFLIHSSSFIYGLTADFDSVEVSVKEDDHTPQQFIDATKNRIQELTDKKNDALHIPLLLAQEVWNTSNGQVLMLRYLEDENYSISAVKSEVHMLLGNRYAIAKGESFQSQNDPHRNDKGRIAYKYIDPKPMEAKLLNIAQNIKGYSDASKAPEGFCLAGVVMNHKTMGYDIETAMFTGFDEENRVPDIDWTIDMEGQYPDKDEPNLLKRIEQSNKDLRLLILRKGASVNTIRFGQRKINGMDSYEVAESIYDKKMPAFQFNTENAIPGEQRSLLRPGFSVSLNFGNDDKPSPVSQDQAIKLWDDMINSIRLSPANGGSTVDPQTGQLPPIVKVGEPCPRTGVWVPSLPSNHPSAKHLATYYGRFKQVAQGQPMPEFYSAMHPSEQAKTDELNAALVWSWVRAV